MSKRTSLLALTFVSIVLVGVILVPPTPAAALNTQSIPPITGWTQLPNGVWYKVEDTVSPIPLPNATGTAISDKVFIYNYPAYDASHSAVYGIRESTNWGLNATGKAYIHRVWLVSDPDGSLSGTSSRPSGDEVVVVTTGILFNGTYQAKRYRTFNWYNVTYGAGGVTFTQLNEAELTALANTIILGLAYALTHADPIALAYLAWGISLMNNDSAPILYGSNYAYFTWWIDQDFFPHFLKTSTFNDIDLMQIRHRLMGLVAFNDTNDNGIMDLKYQTLVSNVGAPYRAVASSEAMYVFQPTSARTVAGSIPVYNATTEYVDWSMTMTGVSGTLVAAKNTLLNINTEIDQVGFAFHFKRSGNDAIVKVDEHIGTFSIVGDPRIVNLSLAIAYFSYFEVVSVNRYHPAVATNAGTPVDTESNSTGNVPILNIGVSGAQPPARIGIAGDNYVWGGDDQSHTAYSNILPWFFFSECFTTVGNYSVTGFAFNKFMYFYVACFPQWGGYSITHDPYFAVTSFTPSGGEGLGLPIVLIAAGAGIGVLLAVAAVLMNRRKKQAIGSVPVPHP